MIVQTTLCEVPLPTLVFILVLFRFFTLKMFLLHHRHMTISMKGDSFKTNVTTPYVVTAMGIMEKNTENRMGGVLGETAFKPSHTWNVLKIITNRGFECIFLIYILHS